MKKENKSQILVSNIKKFSLMIKDNINIFFFIKILI